MTQGGKHTIQYTNDVLWKCTPETYVILLTMVSTINSIQIKKRKYVLGLHLTTQKRKSEIVLNRICAATFCDPKSQRTCEGNVTVCLPTLCLPSTDHPG